MYINHTLNSTNEPEFFAYHRVKRKFLSITEVESEKPEDIEIYEFSNQNFKLVAK
jgi:ribosomal protein L20A (L18A)